MANINKLKLGTEDPDAIMLDKLYIKRTGLKFDFTNWEINTSAGHDLVIESDRIIISKFKPNVWLIRDKVITGAANHAICEYCQGTVMYSTGISEHTDILNSGYRADNNHGAGNDIPQFIGFCIYPATFESTGCVKMLPQRAYTWENTWTDADNRNGASLADYGPGFRLGSGGHGVYGIWVDFTEKTMFPDELYDFNTWGKQTGNQTAAWRYAMALYTGLVQDFSDLTWTAGDGATLDGNKIKITTRIQDGSTDYHVAKWAGINPMKLKVTGLSEGDRFEYGTINTAVNSSESSITTDGTYDIPGIGDGSNGVAFRVYGTGTSEVTIEFVNDLTDENGLIDISDKPITLYLYNSNGIDLSSIECWDVYAENEQVYHKDKTIDNCLKKYGYLKLEQTSDGPYLYQHQFTDVNSVLDNYVNINKLIVPVTGDIDEILSNSDVPVSFNLQVQNEEFWDKIKQHASTVGFKFLNLNYNNIKGLFQHSNIGGVLNIKCANVGKLEEDGLYHHASLAGDRMFEYTNLTEVHFTFIDGEEGAMFTSCNTLFKSMPLLTTITSNVRFGTVDLSGVFEYDSSIETIPGLFDYTYVVGMSVRQLDENYTQVYPVSHLTQYMYESCTNLKTIEQSAYAGSFDSNQNRAIINSAASMFRDCYSLETVNTYLDFSLLYPQNAHLMFENCNKLSSVKIANLNHGTWRFDGQTQEYDWYNETTGDDGQVVITPTKVYIKIGNLVSLNQESITFLFDNLWDLTTNNPNLEYTPTNEEESIFGNDYDFASNPWVDSASIYCPQEWNDKITTEMIQAANAKGWSIYVNGSLRTE